MQQILQRERCTVLSTRKPKLSVRELALFGVYAALMFLLKFAMQGLPNIHPLGLFIIVLTVQYRYRALIPLYVYVMIDGIVGGFALWWVPYLYIWTPLWAMAMGVSYLVRRFHLSGKVAAPLYMCIAALHGFSFGTLYAPFQALAYGLNFGGMLTWIAAGIPFDIVHGVSNFFVATLVVPMSAVVKNLEQRSAAALREPPAGE